MRKIVGVLSIVLLLVSVSAVLAQDKPDQGASDDTKTLIQTALKRIHILKDPKSGIWDQRKDFTTNKGEKFLVFDNLLPRLPGQSFYYQYEPPSRKIYGDDKSMGVARVELLEVKVRRKGQQEETMLGLRLVAGNEDTAKGEKGRKWLIEVGRYFGLRPDDSVALFPPRPAGDMLYAIRQGDSYLLYDMKGNKITDAQIIVGSPSRTK